MLRHRRQVVDGEGEDGAALAELVLDQSVARLTREADAGLRILHELAYLAPAAVETDVLGQLLPLHDAGHRLACRLGRDEPARPEKAPIRRHREATREAIGERTRPPAG